MYNKKLYNYLKNNHMTYQQYLQSDHWKDVRSRFWASKLCHNKCESCGATRNLQVHHRSYTRLGNERLNDLMLLCGDCHWGTHLLLEKKKKNTNIWNAAKKYKRTTKEYRERLTRGKK